MKTTLCVTINTHRTESLEILCTRFWELRRINECRIIELFPRSSIDKIASRNCQWSSSSVIRIDTAIDGQSLTESVYICVDECASISNHNRINIWNSRINQYVTSLSIVVFSSNEDEEFSCSWIINILSNLNISSIDYNCFRTRITWARINFKGIIGTIRVIIISIRITVIGISHKSKACTPIQISFGTWSQLICQKCCNIVGKNCSLGTNSITDNTLGCLTLLVKICPCTILFLTVCSFAILF